MCGIVGATTHREVSAILMEGLRRLEYRGYDSAGIALQTFVDQKLKRVRRLGKVSDLLDALQHEPISGFVGIAHTRWATHGEPNESNAHPHISNDSIAIVHNGIIENHEELRAELVKCGYEFESDTDSETVVHLVHRHFKETASLTEAVAQARERLQGAYALAVISKDSPGEMVVARHNCPLVLGLGMGEHFVASDVVALRPVTDRFIFLQDGDLACLTPDSLKIFDRSGEPVERKQEHVTVRIDEMDKQNYRHFMAKEIHEQPRAVRSTLEGKLANDHIHENALGIRTSTILNETKSITIVGCGTSYYAGCVARQWIEDLAQIPCNVEIASEFRYRNFVVQPGSLFVSVSQSGETADTLAALREAKKRNFLHTIAIANVPNSSLVRESELAIMMNAGIEVSVASTKAFVTMLLNFLLLAVLMGRRNGLTAEQEAEIVKELHGLDRAVYRALGLDRLLQGLAEEFTLRNNALFLGRGLHHPIACEGALKLKELSYIHAEGFPAGELKHGPLALIEADTPVIAVAPNDELLEKVQSNLEEVRARRGMLYVFSDAEAEFEESDTLRVIRIPKVHPLLSPIVSVVPLQLLAYHVAVQKGTDVDQPRNLAKSVTVE